MRVSRRRSRRARRLLTMASLALLTPVGAAYLAANVVPVTYAGQTQVPVVIPTAHTARDAFVNVVDSSSGSLHLLHMSATFVVNGQNVGGALVTFSYDGHDVACPNPTTTNGQGAAHCTGEVTNDSTAVDSLPATYTATITGGPFDGMSATGSVTKCTGGGSAGLPACPSGP